MAKRKYQPVNPFFSPKLGPAKIIRKGLSLSEPPFELQHSMATTTYSPEWINSLRKRIRRRDNLQCQLCSTRTRPLHVHHIDYNKANCQDSNLITLCDVCHKKTLRHTHDWFLLFSGRMRTLPLNVLR